MQKIEGATISPWEALACALGSPHATPQMIAAEAEARVALGHLPGRPGGSYSSALEAGVDHRRWLFEMDVKTAVSVHAAALDDVDGAFGDRAAADAAKLLLDEFRRREFVARENAPIAQRIALGWDLRDAERDLESLVPDAPRPQYADDEPVVLSGIRAHRTPNDPPRAEDLLRKAELRATIRARAQSDVATDYSRACCALQSVRSRIHRWESEHPKLAAASEARA